MSVSYANVAANGSKSDKPEDAAASLPAAPSSPVLAPAAVPDAAPVPVLDESVASDTSALDTDSASGSTSSAASPTLKKEKKALAPAPVPQKAVWGTTAQPHAASVDEHKWPTPDKVPELLQGGAKNAAQKFIKPNKWVPITAKVILPSARPGQAAANGQQKNKRKNKNTKKKVAASPNGAAKKDDALAKDEDAEVEFAPASEDRASPETLHDAPDAATDPLHPNYNYQDGYIPRYNANGSSSGQNAQNKNYRRYQNGGVPHHKGQSAPQQPRQQNGYYQQFVPGQYQNNGANRQYQPNGDAPQFSRNNSNPNFRNNYMGHNGFHPMAMPFVPLPHHPQPMMAPGIPFGAPMPLQVPPPISPKQDPQQALTQQIDYYFSLENLIRDVFLRKSMGTEGWVELDLILNFKRVKIIVNGIKNAIEESDENVKADLLDRAILKAVQLCQNLEIGYLNGKEDYNATATEVQLRVKSNFEQWLLPAN